MERIKNIIHNYGIDQSQSKFFENLLVLVGCAGAFNIAIVIECDYNLVSKAQFMKLGNFHKRRCLGLQLKIFFHFLNSEDECVNLNLDDLNETSSVFSNYVFLIDEIAYV